MCVFEKNNLGLPYTDMMLRILIVQLDRQGIGLVLTNNNYLELIATKSCKYNFFSFLSVILGPYI